MTKTKSNPDGTQSRPKINHDKRNMTRLRERRVECTKSHCNGQEAPPVLVAKSKRLEDQQSPLPKSSVRPALTALVFSQC